MESRAGLFDDFSMGLFSYEVGSVERHNIPEEIDPGEAAPAACDQVPAILRLGCESACVG